ncbi:hypothetical protein Celaphus_00007587 [Cervus elaphus hippelaphus]|uniref:Uncharacterized protein n=1 Tax=Cervus elaphus hippelaphus TaxID=46360 RepID=A0A212CAJ3_CEREH|nr:hypothetical protein Celaphus_00007587 [Cervus elaphus hippelaphus]
MTYDFTLRVLTLTRMRMVKGTGPLTLTLITIELLGHNCPETKGQLTILEYKAQNAPQLWAAEEFSSLPLGMPGMVVFYPTPALEYPHGSRVPVPLRDTAASRIHPSSHGHPNPRGDLRMRP